MWALGCLVYLMMVGVTPFYDPEKRRYDRTRALREGAYRTLGTVLGIKDPPSSDADDFVAALLRIDPVDRLGAPGGIKVATHSWLAAVDWAALREKRVAPPMLYAGSDMVQEPRMHRISTERISCFKLFDDTVRGIATASGTSLDSDGADEFTKPQGSTWPDDSHEATGDLPISGCLPMAKSNENLLEAAKCKVSLFCELQNEVERERGFACPRKQIETRKLAIKTWCALRSLACPDRKLWKAILCEEFVYTHPVTPYCYQHLPSLSDCGTFKTFAGIDEFLCDVEAAQQLEQSDTANEHARLNDGVRSSQGIEPFRNIVLDYDVADDDILISVDIQRAAFTCTLKELSRGASTVAMGHVIFRGPKIAEITLTLDVLGFSKHISQSMANLHEGHSNLSADLQRKSFFSDNIDGAVAEDAPLHLPRVSDYMFSHKLGQGAFGKVWLAKEVVSGNTVAIKTLNKNFLVTTGLWRRAATEKLVLEIMQHPFIVKQYFTFQDKETIYIVLEYVPGGTLSQLLKSQPEGCITECHAQFLSAEILCAINYLHERLITFRDLKPENVLLSASGHACLTDFGSVAVPQSIASCIDESKENAANASFPSDDSQGERNIRTRRTMVSLHGSPLFMAPEIIRGSGYGPEVDFWSFGVLLYAKPLRPTKYSFNHHPSSR